MSDIEAQEAILDVMARYPDITVDGFNGHRRGNFDERRADLLSPGAIEQFIEARVWLDYIPRRTSPNERCDSYRIKHVIEHWFGKYISNGVCIAAALSLDIEIKRCPSGINAYLGIAGQRKWPAERDSVTL
jgi:hypothetical protein